jgi:hypothetical protein
MAAEDSKLDKVIEHLESLHGKCDAINKRMDSIEEDHKKLRADADAEEAKKREEKEKADAAKGAARADATDENRNAFAGAQMRLDSACQAWGHQCRPPLAGESLRDYRVSVLNGLKAHSKRYGQSDLSLVGDEAAFNMIEGAIINDAVEASTSNIKPGAPLRSVTKRNPDTGHAVTSFYGDPLVTWAQFAGGATRFGKIVRPSTH